MTGSACGQQLPFQFADAMPGFRAGDIHITDCAPVVRARATAPGQYEVVIRRWSWPGPSGRPVFNLRSEGREFASGRCLVIADGFYEFADPAERSDKKTRRWLFTRADGGLLGIAGVIRHVPGLGEAFAMLTTEPGPDIASHHDRQAVVLPRRAWKAWLDGHPAAELLRPSAAGSLIARPE